jgi:hypothetical protein
MKWLFVVLTLAPGTAFGASQLNTMITVEEAKQAGITCRQFYNTTELKPTDPCLTCVMNAEHLCTLQNRRLPTIREMAEYAKTQGANGIRPEGYYSIFRYDENHQIVLDFRFDNLGYRAPVLVENSNDRVFVWTSSVAPVANPNAGARHYRFEFADGKTMTATGFVADGVDMDEVDDSGVICF